MNDAPGDDCTFFVGLFVCSFVCLSVCLSVTEKSTISFVSDQGGLIATAEDERPKVILKRALVLHGKYKHSCSHFKGAQWNQIYWLILSFFFLSHPLLCLIRHIEAGRIINISDTHARTHAQTLNFTTHSNGSLVTNFMYARKFF